MSHVAAQQASPLAIVTDRQTRMLRTAMGPVIARALEDPEIVEILLNPDGSLWFDRLGAGRAPSGLQLTSQDAERIIRLVAAHLRLEVHAGAPVVSGELPDRDLGDLKRRASRSLRSMQRRATLVTAFWQQAELF